MTQVSNLTYFSSQIFNFQRKTPQARSLGRCAYQACIGRLRRFWGISPQVFVAVPFRVRGLQENETDRLCSGGSQKKKNEATNQGNKIQLNLSAQQTPEFDALR